MPDPTTFRILAWRTGENHTVGRLFCDVLKPGGEPYEGDPRFQMRRALARAKELGFAHYYLGPELEFFLFKSDEAPEVLDKGGSFDLTTLDVASDFRRDVVFTLRELGIPVEYTHHEVGPSQPTWRWWAPCSPARGSSGSPRSPPPTPARRWRC
jgi:glutamine synthetase